MVSNPTLPDAHQWRTNPLLGQVRAGQIELKLGAKDAAPNGAIQMVQQSLVYWGRKVQSLPSDLLPVYGADGTFGSESKAALARFQRANKDSSGQPLVDDGILGDLTMGVLDGLFKAPPTPPTPPLPTPDTADDGSLIEIFVDIVYFQDGPELSAWHKVFPVANEVFERLDIKVSKGDRIYPWGVHGTKPLDSNVLAHNAFEINRKMKRPVDQAQSVLSTLTAKGVRTTELDRITLFSRRDRVTAFFTAPFPETMLGSVGVTFNTLAYGTPPSIFVTKSPVVADCFWHELGHVLLNTPMKHEDHQWETFMDIPTHEKWRTAKILPEQRQKIRATARTLR